MTNENADALIEELKGFYGSDTIYMHPLFKKKYSEGVRHLAEKASSYWLLDAIYSHQLTPSVRRQEFQVWKLFVDGSRGFLVCEDGDGNEVARQDIEYTDFPLAKIELWFENDTLVLPAER